MTSVSIRAVAKKCHVSVGSIYNYFPAKVDLVTAIIQEVWKDIFHMEEHRLAAQSFPDHVLWIFQSVKSGMAKYPEFFFAHSMIFANDEKGHGRSVMEQYFSHIKDELLEALQCDENVNSQAFTEEFTRSDFVDFVFINLLALFARQADSCCVLREIICRTIY